MATPRLKQLTCALPSTARRLALPAAISFGLMVVVACGGSDADDTGFDNSTGGVAGGLGFAGSVSTPTAGTFGTTGGSSSASSGSGGGQTGGKGGVASTDGGSGGGSGGKAGKGDPKEPKGGSGGSGGAGGVGSSVGGSGGGGGGGGSSGGGMAGSGGATATCPVVAPADKAVCSTPLECEYADVSCECSGKEQDRTWHCKEPMTTCPAKKPKDGGACTLKATEPCHYEMDALDCTCTANKWVCVAGP